jgi:hypothetical protein
VGEIGRTPGELKHGLKWWEIRCIIRGYNRRHRDLWSATRWQTYNLMAAQVGGKQLSENGINSVHDLLPLPWDNKNHNEPALTQAEIDKEVEMMRAINQQLKEKNNI